MYKFLIVLTVLVSSCSETTRLDSEDFAIAEERIKILNEEIRASSRIADAQFELFNVNGFNGSQGLSVPGGSSTDYRFAVKLDTSDMSKWTDGMIEVDLEHYDDTWAREIVKHCKEDWQTTSPPTYYVRQGLPDGWSTRIIKYYRDAIIFKRVIAN